MFSLVDSSDPPCSSSKVSGFRADERDSDQLPLQEADPVVRFGEARTSNFSIRDHVFALRNKSIGKSWPFPSQLLQLCLKNGIRDLLPPFEPPNSVRAHCLSKSASETEKVTVSSSQLGETVLLDREDNSTRTDHLCLPSDQQDLLRCSDKREARCLCEQDKYDHNLVNDVCEIGSTVTNHCDNDILSTPIGGLIVKPGVIPETIQAEENSTTSTASDIMASKVCPVCKAFSSTSNTTLNAHMDQCLSLESDAALALDKLPKLRVKPGKKRLMEDIYASAPRCTLEDLDRRNGSTWATDLTVAALSAEANSELKKPKLSQLEPRHDKNEGAVYVDSNGIKLRILSKFNDAPQVLSREEFRPKRNFRSVQDGKIILIKNKKHFIPPYLKKMKFKLRNKKLSYSNLLENEVQVEPKVVHHEESHLEDEGSPFQLSGEADQILSCGSATLKNWPSSKRSDLAKKVSKKDFHKILEHPKPPDTQMEMLETRKPALDTPSASRSHFGKLSQLLESKTVDVPSKTVRSKENQEKNTQRWSSESNSANVLLKLSRVSGSLVSSSRSTDEECYMGRKQKSHTSPKTTRRSADQTYHLPLKTKRVSTLSGSNSSTIKFRKHRSLLAWTDKRIGEFSSDSNPRQHRCVEAVISGQDEELITNEHLHPESSQYQDTQTRISEMQVDQNVDLDTSEKADANCILSNPLISQDQEQDLQLNTNVRKNLTVPIEENEKQDKSTPDKLENSGVESQAKDACAQESSACLTSHGDLEIDIPRTNSTLVFDPSVPNQGRTKLVSCREPSISTASSASTISPASPNDYHSKASVLSTVQGKSSFPLSLLTMNEGTQGMDVDSNQPVELDSTVKKPHQLSDYHPCCCSWQSIMPGNMPPTKQKPLPNLHVRPSISSFYAYSSLKSDAANAPSLESPTESILTRACSDVGSTSPSSGTPTQSSSNSILRLMGKDLMVVHNEESAQLPKVLPPATDSNSTVQALPSPLGFASYATVSNHDTFSFAVCNQQTPSITNLQARNCLPAFHQRNMNHKAFTPKEVIVIDDSDDVFAPRDASSHVPVSHTMFQRPFTYFPPHSHLLPKDNGFRLSNPANQGRSVPATPFVFQTPSASHLNSPFYYPQSLR